MRRTVGFAMVAAMCVASFAHAYDGPLHQQLTFLAAKQFNRCVNGTPEPLLTPLQVRYMARANVVQAEGGWFRSMFRWNYYDRGAKSKQNLLWLIETRVHGHFDTNVKALATADDMAERFSNLGRVANTLQDMTSPAHVVPVYMARWWRLSMGDRFNAFPLDEQAVASALGDDCADVYGRPLPFEEILETTADATLAALTSPIDGLPVSWEAFWKLDENPAAFGSYGVAGNSFGRKSAFNCPALGPDTDSGRSRQRCVLLEDDPIYAAFAVARHEQAVRATIRAIASLRLDDTPPGEDGIARR